MAFGISRHLRSAVHHNSWLSARGLLERTFTFFFKGLVYNQIWEDPMVDMEALKLRSDSRLITIASAGCNALNYVTALPESITAVDFNRKQVYLTRLKLAALEHLPDYEEFFQFFGEAESSENLANYEEYIRPHLDEETREFWDGGSWFRKMVYGPRVKQFSRNFYRYGLLGYFIRFAHMVCRTKGLEPAMLLHAEDLEEQRTIFDEVFAPLFETRRVRLVGNAPFFLFGLGVPPRQREALQQEANGSLASLYYRRIRRLACNFPIDENYFAWQAFGHTYDRQDRRAVPPYLRRRNYRTLRNNIDRISTRVGSVHDYLRTQQAGALDRFVLLDAQDWMPMEHIRDLWAQIARVGSPGSRVIFRTISSQSPVERALEPSLYRRFEYKKALSQELFTQDRSAVYGGFHLYVLRN